MAPTLRTVLAFWTVLALALPAAALVIDDFESAPFTLTDTAATGTGQAAEQSGIPHSSVIGGVRRVTANASGAGLTATASLATTAGDDSLLLEADPSGGVFFLLYDRIANDTFDASNGALNLNLSNAPSLQLDMISTGTGGALRATLYDSDSNQSSALLPIVSGSLVIPMSVFSGLDLTDIQAIRFFISGITSTNSVSISHIQAVPEPAAALLLGLGLAGMALRRRSV